jgi:hypothetical protein
MIHTPLIIQLFEHLADDLPDALQRLDVLLRLVKLLLQVLDLEPQRLQLGLPFARLEQFGLVLL